LFTDDIDCLTNGAPYSSEAGKFVDFFSTLPSGEDSFFIRTFITYDLFHKVEKLQTKDFSISEMGEILLSEIELAKSLISNIDMYKEKLDFKFISEQTDSFDKVTQEHYGKLFENFSEYHYYEEAFELLKMRFERNNIHIDNFENKLALDDGCGGGRYTLALNKMGFKEVYGLDWSETNIKTANYRKELKNIQNVQYVQGDVLNLPFDDEKFDFVFSNGVLHHTVSIENGLREIFRVMKKGAQGFLYLIEKPGGVHWDTVELLRLIMKPVNHEYARDTFKILGVPNNRIFYILDHIMVPINTRSTSNELEKLLEDIGFKNIERLTRGSDFDRVENIHNEKNKDDTIWKYGIGENRYIFEK